VAVEEVPAPQVAAPAEVAEETAPVAEVVAEAPAEVVAEEAPAAEETKPAE